MDLVTLDQVRIILAISMLGIAAISDIRKREVRNIVWVVFGAIAVIIIPFSPDINAELINIGISLLGAPIALLMWRFGAFGGADALGIIIVAILAPAATITSGAITPFTTLLNALVFSVGMFFANFVRNLIISKKRNIFEGFEEPRFRRIVAMFIGRRAKRPRFAFSMEQQTQQGKKLYLKLQHAGRAELCDTQDTWVTLGTPYMIFILAGFVVQLLYGDFVFNLFNALS